MNILIRESEKGQCAIHLRIVLDTLAANQNEGSSDRDYLISILFCVLIEREIVPYLMKDLIQSQEPPKFGYRKQFCEDAARHFLILLEMTRSKRSVVKIEMTTINSSLLFDVLITSYGARTYSVTFKNPETSNRAIGVVYDMKKYLTSTEEGTELNFSALKDFSDITADKLIFPILNLWWQNHQLYSRLPYLLGIPENCIWKIGRSLLKADRNNLRLTCGKMKESFPRRRNPALVANSRSFKVVTLPWPHLSWDGHNSSHHLMDEGFVDEEGENSKFNIWEIMDNLYL